MPPSSASPPAKPRFVSAEFVASAPEVRVLPPPVGVEIAFAGRSNVGKSTLLNALMERRGLARTSSTPGCTREVVLFQVKTREGAVITLADLPGYGYAKRSKSERAAWATLLEDYLLGRPTLCGVVLLVDPRRGLESEERDLLELLASPPRVSRRALGTLLVATKLDKLSASARKPAVLRLSAQAGRKVIGFTESDRSSHDALWRGVLRIAGLEVEAGHAATPGSAQGTEPTVSAPESSRTQSP